MGEPPQDFCKFSKPHLRGIEKGSHPPLMVGGGANYVTAISILFQQLNRLHSQLENQHTIFKTTIFRSRLGTCSQNCSFIIFHLSLRFDESVLI